MTFSTERQGDASAMSAGFTTRSRVELRVNNFDLIRLLAAAQVAVFHSVEHLGIEAVRGSAYWPVFSSLPGVPVFFVVSGFLISMSYERSRSDWEYFRNRALRIFPALWVCLVVSVATVVAFGFSRISSSDSMSWAVWWAAQMSFLQFHNPEFLRAYGVGVLNGSLWTIPVELQFYMALPIGYAVLRLRKGSGNLALCLLAVVGMAVHTWFAHWTLAGSHSTVQKLLGVSLAPYLYMFILGVLAQRNLERLRWLFFGRALHWVVLLAIVTVACSFLGLTVSGNNLNPVSMVALAGLTISAAFTRATLGQALLDENDISYGLYIYHMPVVNLLAANGFVARTEWLAAAVGLTTVFAILSWIMVERPFLRRKLSGLRSLR